MQRVIIAGFGPVGRALADALSRHGVPFTIVETNAETVRAQQALGRHAVHGDATDPDTLRAAGIADAAAIAITIPDSDAALEACRTARSLAPDAYIAARVAHMSQAMLARQFGADSVTVEEIATAEALADSVSRVLASTRQHLAEGAD